MVNPPRARTAPVLLVSLRRRWSCEMVPCVDGMSTGVVSVAVPRPLSYRERRLFDVMVNEQQGTGAELERERYGDLRGWVRERHRTVPRRRTA